MSKHLLRKSGAGELVKFAKSLGFIATMARGGHIRFSREGCTPVFTSATPGDFRAWQNCKSELRRRFAMATA